MRSTCTRAFTEAFWCFANTDIMTMCMKKCHAKKINCFWKSDCLSNLAILYGLCILDSSFLYWPLLCGEYLISIAYCPFFSWQWSRIFNVEVSSKWLQMVLQIQKHEQKSFLLSYCSWHYRSGNICKSCFPLQLKKNNFCLYFVFTTLTAIIKGKQISILIYNSNCSQ